MALTVTQQEERRPGDDASDSCLSKAHLEGQDDKDGNDLLLDDGKYLPFKEQYVGAHTERMLLVCTQCFPVCARACVSMCQFRLCMCAESLGL